MAQAEISKHNVAVWFEIPAFAHFIDSEGNRVGMHSLH